MSKLMGAVGSAAVRLRIARATALDKDEWNILEDMEVDTMAVVPIMHPLMANAPFGVLQVRARAVRGMPGDVNYYFPFI